jgi:hypothetical protein
MGGAGPLSGMGTPGLSMGMGLGMGMSVAMGVGMGMHAGTPPVPFETRTAESLKWFEVPQLVQQLQALGSQVSVLAAAARGGALHETGSCMSVCVVGDTVMGAARARSCVCAVCSWFWSSFRLLRACVQNASLASSLGVDLSRVTLADTSQADVRSPLGAARAGV